MEVLLDSWKFGGFLHMLRLAAHLLHFRMFSRRPDKPGHVRLFGSVFHYDSHYSYFHSLVEHYGGNVYWFRTSRPDPVIIDVGANIGDSVLYFKWLYPRAVIHSFEPGTPMFRLLKRNVAENRLSDVHMHHEALSGRDGTIELTITPGSYLGSSFHGPPLGYDETLYGMTEREEVVMRRFSDRIRELGIDRIDMLKVDIEGSETELLRDAAPLLGQVERIAVEYHVAPDSDHNSFDETVSILHDAGFDLSFHHGGRDGENRTPYAVLMIQGFRKR